MSYSDQPARTPAFTGTSTESRAKALDNAAEEAQTFFKEQGREGRIFLQVLREEVAIGNPHISEFRIIVVESGGSG